MPFPQVHTLFDPDQRSIKAQLTLKDQRNYQGSSRLVSNICLRSNPRRVRWRSSHAPTPNGPLEVSKINLWSPYQNGCSVQTPCKTGRSLLRSEQQVSTRLSEVDTHTEGKSKHPDHPFRRSFCFPREYSVTEFSAVSQGLAINNQNLGFLYLSSDASKKKGNQMQRR